MSKREIKTLTITGDDRKEYHYYVVCEFSAGVRNYVALSPQSGKDNVIELYRYSENGSGMVHLSNITSDSELDDIKRKYNKLMKAERNALQKDDSGLDNNISIINSNGNAVFFEVIATFDFEGSYYVALMPIEDGAAATICLFGYSLQEENATHDKMILNEIPDKVLSKVQDYFMSAVRNEVQAGYSI